MALPTPEEVEASKDVLFHCVAGGSRVVGIGNDIVVKYGPRVQMTEADSLAFVGDNTTLPIPISEEEGRKRRLQGHVLEYFCYRLSLGAE
jgi:hypothetical protein